MNNTVKTTFFGVVAMTGLLMAGAAKADGFNIGLGVSEGRGSFLTFGMASGGRGGYGHGYGQTSYHGHGHGDVRMGFGYSVCPPPVVCAPRPVYYPAPVVYAAPPPVVIVRSGYWQEREERYWVEGNWVETLDGYGRRCKMWQPGRWDVRRIREWVE